jgi:hypothetical protein
VVNLEGLTAGIGWTYDGEKFSAPPEPEPTHDELVQKAEIHKQALISDANNYIDSNQWPSKLALDACRMQISSHLMNGLIILMRWTR